MIEEKNDKEENEMTWNENNADTSCRVPRDFFCRSRHSSVRIPLPPFLKAQLKLM